MLHAVPKQFLLFALLLFIGMRHRRGVLSLLALASLVVIIFAFYIGATSSKKLSKTVAGLESGKVYLWKVIVEDGKGGATESETRHFTTK